MRSLKLFKLAISFFPPLASVILMIFGSAFYTTFISLHLDSIGYSRNDIGIVQSAYFLGVLVGGFQMEKFINRVGHIQALAVFGSVATTSTLAQALYPNFYALCFFRFAVGLSLAALYIVIESWMLYNSCNKTRGLILSLYMISLYTAQSASQQLLSFIDLQSFTPYILSAIFTSLSVIPVGLSTFRVEKSHDHKPLSFTDIARSSPFGFAGCLISGLLLSALYSFFPIFSESIGIPSQTLMSLIIAGGVTLQLPIGKLSDYFERRRVLLITVLIAALLSTLGIFFSSFSTVQVLIITFLLGGFLFTLYPLSITQVCDHLDSAHVTTATAMLLIAYGSGSVVGPIASSLLIELFSINALFLYFAVLLFILTLVGTYSTLRRPIVPLVDQTDFVPLPSNTTVGVELDPRAEGGGKSSEEGEVSEACDLPSNA